MVNAYRTEMTGSGGLMVSCYCNDLYLWVKGQII